MNGSSRSVPFRKEPSRLFQSASGIEQVLFTGHLYPCAEVPVCRKVVHHHVREVVNVDDDFVDAVIPKVFDRDLKQRPS